MEDNFNQNEFEEFLQHQVRNHRMYPSDTIWREIDRKLHGEKRWPALTIAAAAILTTTVLICVYFTPKPNLFLIQPINSNSSSAISLKENISSSSNLFKPEVKELSATHHSLPDIASSGNVSIDISKSFKQYAQPLLIKKKEKNNISNYSKDQTISSIISDKNTYAPANIDAEPTSAINNTSAVKNSLETLAIIVTKDKNVKDYNKDPGKKESVLASNHFNKVKGKFSYQIYIAPSISYRKLSEDQSLEKPVNAGPVGLNFVTDVNNVVRHKPGTGIEAGFSILYNVSNKVRLKSGFQFNVRQYSIEAYRSNIELASIALVGSNRIDTVNTLSYYRNNNGYYSAELVNRYYQLSVPLGLEWQIIGNRNIQLNVAGTIQPTYLLNRNAYLLSSNFKNYTESPGIVRQFNLNSNIEAFVSFKSGNYKWQLGPQLRYQPYSTFIAQYAIKEHLLDYGIKLGISHSIR